jgi:hypothetical protein
MASIYEGIEHMTAHAKGDHNDDEGDPVPFEDVVAALLQVDPQGIIGKEGKDARKARDDLSEADDS